MDNHIRHMRSCNFPSLGSYIRDAVDGSYTPYRVGSQDEHRFWKMFRRRVTDRDIVKCFYLNPETCERDLKIKISETEKRLWHLDRESYAGLVSESVSSK